MIKIRHLWKLRQVDLAQKLGVSQEAISQYESGKRKIPKTIEKLIEYLNIKNQSD